MRLANTVPPRSIGSNPVVGPQLALGYKMAPVAPPPGDEVTDPRPLILVGPEEVWDARLSDLAGIAVDAIRDGIAHHHDATDTVVEMLTQLFLGGSGSDELERIPSIGVDGHHQHLSALLADPVALAGVVDRVIRIIRDEPLR